MHTTHEHLSDLAVALPTASKVFQELRLDYCCHGRRPLVEACRDAGLDADDVLARIVADGAQGPAIDRAAQSIGELVADIVDTYHAALRRELPALVEMALRVERVHGEKASCPRGLAGHLERLQGTLLVHLDREEQLLFPAIRDGLGASCHAPVVHLEAEHAEVGAALARTRALTADLVPPAAACTTWRALYLRLRQLESDLFDHVHLENNVLFPRVLAA